MRCFLYSLLLLFVFDVQSQSRYNTSNQIGWWMYVGDHALSEKWSLHTEYQWRRTDFISHWQQSLARVGINYAVHPQALLTFGYAQAQTFSYGELPLARLDAMGEQQDFPEHRLYQDLLLKNNTGIFEINHRLKLEERWLGVLYQPNNDRRTNEWRFLMRMRYRFRVAMPLQGKTIDDKEFYLHAFDEILVGFGDLLGVNVFDQNRFQLGLGYRVHKDFKFELGFFHQIVQKPALHPSLKIPVYEFNAGFLISTVYNIDFKKKEKAANP